MVFGLDAAVLSWLIASGGDALLGRLRGDRVEKAMRQLVADSITATVAEVAAHLDGQKAEHLRSVLLGHDAPVDRVAVSSSAELHAALQKWIAALDHPEFGGPGYLAALSVDADPLCDGLAGRITAGIRENGRSGGPLGPAAKWLWRDELSTDLGHLKRDIAYLRHVVEPPSSYRGGLPGGVSDFTGRQHVLSELAERVQAHDPTGIVVAIHAVDGMAGVGKTELALRAAHQHKHRYSDGQYFINLHGYTEGIPPMPPDTALEELLRQAGVSGQEVPPDLAGRQARWQTLMYARNALVLLDNALDSEQVRPLLPNSAGCLVLITSRIRLRDLPGARALQLDLLTPAEAITLFTRVTSTERPLDRDTVAKIVELVGRLPVAVRTIASQIDDDYTEAELAEDLARAKSRANLTDANGPLGGAVWAAFATSLQRLDPHHRRAFQTLGVHPGPVIGTPQFAALAHLPVARARSILRELADRHLVTPAPERVGHRRYEMHDLVREYARQQADRHLSAQERTAAIARLTIWYATAVGALVRLWGDTPDSLPTAEPAVQGLRLHNAGDARGWLAAEQDNLLAFSEHATSDDTAHVCHHYAERLYQLDCFGTARTLYGRAAATYQQTGNHVGEVNALVGMGNVARLTSDYRGAGRSYRTALEIDQQTSSRVGEADALRGLGYLHLRTGDHKGAGGHFGTALEIDQQTGNRVGEADASRGLGDVALAAGDHPAAARHLRAALAIYEAAGFRRKEAYALRSLGRLSRRTGDYSGASEHYRAALDIDQQTGNRNGEANSLTGLGHIARATRNHSEAADYFHAGLAIYRRIGNRSGEASALTGLGHVAMAAGNPSAEGRREEARERWQRALAIYIEIGSPLAESVRKELDTLDRD